MKIPGESTTPLLTKKNKSSIIEITIGTHRGSPNNPFVSPVTFRSMHVASIYRYLVSHNRDYPGEWLVRVFL